jgi:hypothetical protein
MIFTAEMPLDMALYLVGSYQPYEPQTRDYPGSDAYFEDIEIEGLGVSCYMLKDGARRWVTFNVMNGVNANSPDVQRLFANILAIEDVQDRANEELLGARE